MMDNMLLIEAERLLDVTVEPYLDYLREEAQKYIRGHCEHSPGTNWGDMGEVNVYSTSSRAAETLRRLIEEKRERLKEK